MGFNHAGGKNVKLRNYERSLFDVSLVCCFEVATFDLPAEK